MMEILDLLLRPTFFIAAAIYIALAVRVTRSSPQHANSVIAFFPDADWCAVAGSAFSYGTQDPNIYGIGRVLAFFASGFLPLAFFVVYREYTVGPPHPLIIAMLSVIPIATTLLALTNSMHNIIWAVVETETGSYFSDITDHYWFSRVHAPFMYGLFLYAVIGLVGRLPTIAPAHRKTVILLLGCALLPFLVSISNVYLGMGPPDFPFVLIVVCTAVAVVRIRVGQNAFLRIQPDRLPDSV